MANLKYIGKNILNHDLIVRKGNVSGSVTSTGSFGELAAARNATVDNNIVVGNRITADYGTVNYSLVVNEAGHGGGDFRVEGTSDPYLIFADAGTDQLAIGTSVVSPSLLTIDGDVTATHVTASGDISGSSTSTGSFGHLSVQGAIEGPTDEDFSIRSDKNINLYLDNDGDGTFHKFQLYEDGSVFFAVAEDGRAALGEAVTSNHIVGLSVAGGVSGSATSTGSFATLRAVDPAGININAIGTVSSSITSTGSFGRLESTTINGTNIDAATDFTVGGTVITDANIDDDGTLTIDGATGLNLQEGGTDVIAIDTNQDVLFSRTGGSTSDPDVEFDGYIRFDGITEVANTTTSTTSGTGALLVDGGIGVAENVNVGGNLTVTGNYTVNGTTTFISSSTLEIGDNIIQVNSVSPVRYGGIQVKDLNATETGSMVWDSSNDYWLAGQSGSEYRVPIQNTTTALTDNKVIIAQGNGRIESGDITDNGVNISITLPFTSSADVSSSAASTSSFGRLTANGNIHSTDMVATNLYGTVGTAAQNSITSATSLASVSTITTGVWNSTFGAASNTTISGSYEGGGSTKISGSSTSTGSFGLVEIAGTDLNPSGVSRDQVLKFNGTNFVAADYDATFEFTIADFDMNHTTTPVLIGSGSWKAVGALQFTASYNNGPPDGFEGSAAGAPKIIGYVDGSVSSSYDMFPLSSSFTMGTNTMAITFPPDSTDDIRFRLYASAGSDTDNDYTDQRIYFYNQFVYGDLGANNGFTQANIRTLAAANTATSNDTTRTLTVSVGGSNYLCFAHRTGDTNVAQVQCGSGNNILTVAMDRSDATTITPLKETVSYLNTAGHTENFYVYASKLANVDSHSTTFKTLTSTVKKNYFYWGYDAQADTYNESFIETSGDWDSHNANSSYDDGTVTGQTLSVGTFTSKYVIIAFPDRYGDNDSEFVFKDNGTGLPFDVTKQSDVTITNAVGFEETYHVWRSTNLLTMTNLTVLIDSV